MIRELDDAIERLLLGEAPIGSELRGAAISFAVPDAVWRGAGNGLQLNVYLHRVNENRELRSNERRYRHLAGGITVEDFPPRIECHYLITAWNKAALVPGQERELQEHRLLSQVLFVLFRNPVLPRSYVAGALIDQELELPLISARTQDQTDTPDFWTSLGTHARPAIHLRATIALALSNDVEAVPATTIRVALPEGDTSSLIGGVVWNGAQAGQVVANAWVRVDGNEVYTADASGRFRIPRLSEGAHALTVRAVGFQEANRAIQVPEPSGNYDVVLTPL